MRLLTLFILFLSFFIEKPVSSFPLFNNLPNTQPIVPAFYPQFSKPPSSLSQGTPLIPICSNNPSHPACFNQWSRQAIPLSIGTGNQFKYFLPSFIPSSRLRSEANMKGWKKSSSSVKDRFESRSFYFNMKEPGTVRMLERDQQGDIKKILEGSVVYVNLEDIEKTDNEQANQNQLDPESSLKSQNRQEQQKEKVFIEQDNQNQLDPESSLKSQNLPEKELNLDKAKNISGYQTRKDTIALPASGGEEVKHGCFRVNKIDVQTEASFCIECIRDIPENEYFKSLLKKDSFLPKLKSYLSQIKTKSTGKVNSQILGSLSGDGTNQICSPTDKLEAIIGNFEGTCPPYNQEGRGFKRFFGEYLCKSCEKGVPIELMMGMMSIESGGRCTARNTDGEKSAGLFQVDSNQHSCKRGYKKKTNRNTNCLADIHNNWNKSTEILSDFYKGSNGQNIKKPCKNWIDMDSKDRDAFRRAVAGYNGGYWFLNSIRAAKNNNLGDKSKYGITSYKHDKSTWEEMRSFYFIQHIHQDKRFTRRKLSNDLSNLAHTEAILGREVKNSAPGMIEIWSQYKREFLKKNSNQCR